MKKKAFTLIELLAIMVVLAGIFVMVVPEIRRVLENRKIKEFNELSTTIENAAKLYVSENYKIGVDTIPSYLTLGDLSDEDLLDAPVMDPRNGSEFNTDTLITISTDPDGVLVYTFEDGNVLPSVSSATIVSNNSVNDKYAKNGNTITLSIDFNKTIVNTPTPPTVTIGGRSATVSGTGRKRTATYTIPSTESTLTEGVLAISIKNYTDSSGATGDEVKTTTSGGLVNYDRTPPTFTSFYIGGLANPAYISNANTTLHFSTAGVSQVCISTSSTSCTGWVTYGTPLPYIFSDQTNELKTLYAWFRDSADNRIGPYSDTVTLDTIAPPGSLIVNGGSTYTNTASVTLTLSSPDASQMCIKNSATSCAVGDVAWETMATTKAWTLTAGDGTKTVYASFRDSAGNPAGPYSDSIILDTTPTPMNVVINNGATYTNTTNVTLTSSGSDVSGISYMCFTTSSSGCTPTIAYASTYAYTLAAGDGTKTVYASYKDGAGNTTTVPVSDSIILDTTPPTVNYFYIAGSGNPAYIGTTSTVLSSNVIDSSGVPYMCFTTSSSGCTPSTAYASTYAYTLAAVDGTKIVYAEYTDGANNTTINPVSDSIILDTVDPTVTEATIVSNNTNNKYAKNGDTLTLSMKFSESLGTGPTVTIGGRGTANGLVVSGSGITWTATYTIPSAETTLTEGPLSINISGYKDNVPNVGSTVTNVTSGGLITYDRTPPTGTIAINSNATYTNTTAVTLTLTASDATSGLYQECVSTSSSSCNGTWTSMTSSPKTVAYTLASGDATKPLYVWYKDNANNTPTSPSDAASITLDTVDPTGTIVINSNATYTNTTAVTLTLTASDATSGLYQECVSTLSTSCNGTWTSMTSSPKTVAYTFTAGEGTRTLYVWYKDNANNTPTSPSDSASIILDTVDPTGTIAINSNATYTNTTAVTLTLTGSDATSLLKERCVSTISTSCNGTWTSMTSSPTTVAYTFTAGEGTRTLYVWYKDKADNVPTAYADSDSIILDTVDPTGHFYIGGSSNPASITSLTTTLYMYMTDATSGLDKMCISTSSSSCNGTWEDYVATRAYTFSSGSYGDTKTLYMWFKDNATNTSNSPVSDSVQYMQGTHSTTYTCRASGYSYSGTSSWIIDTSTVIEGSPSSGYNNYYGIMYFDLATIKNKWADYDVSQIVFTIYNHAYTTKATNLYVGSCPTLSYTNQTTYSIGSDGPGSGNKPTAIGSAVTSPDPAVSDDPAIFTITKASNQTWINNLMGASSDCLYINYGDNTSYYWEGEGSKTATPPKMVITWTLR